MSLMRVKGVLAVNSALNDGSLQGKEFSLGWLRAVPYI